MLTNDIVEAFARQPTRVLADALIGSQLLGTPAGFKVLNVVATDAAAYGALVDLLARRNVARNLYEVIV